MNRSRPRTVALSARLVVALALTGVVLPLSGCLSAQIPDALPVPTEDTVPTPSEEPIDGEDDALSFDPPAALGFADGPSIDPNALIQWSDGLFANESWQTLLSDDGNGNWSYATVDGTCTAQFWQGYIPDIDTSSGDDLTSTDELLAVVLQADVSQVSAAATTGAFAYQIGGELTAENRTVFGQEGERNWQLMGRAFVATNQGLTLIVDCTGADASTVAADVISQSPVLLTSF